MKKVYIFGLGKGKIVVDQCLLRDKIELLGFIDNYKAGSMAENGLSIIRQDQVSADYDYILISLMRPEDTKQALLRQGVAAEKIICFFDISDAGNEAYWEVLDSYRWRSELMWQHYTRVTMPSLENLTYEIYGEVQEVQNQCPKIIDVDKTVEILLRGRKCLARFGDGEFELMCSRGRANFQDVDDRLSERLKEVLCSKEDNLLVAIANDYGRLDQYTDKAVEDIRSYMSRTVRKDHMDLLDLDREYYDAYISRPYIIYRDKRKAGERFENLRKIWQGQDVLVVEGEHTRFGVGNDLLDNAYQIFRILVPNKNAFSKYDEIIEEVRRRGKDKLILAILGPTATILAYDLAREGYWIIDIGQLDVEYEWYLRGVEERCDIPYKCVSEVMQYGEIQTNEDEDYIKRYQEEVIARVL